MSYDTHTWNFYVVDEDRSWDWSNHVWTMGFVCDGMGATPQQAWQNAIDEDRIPEGYELDYPPSLAIRGDHEIEFALQAQSEAEDFS